MTSPFPFLHTPGFWWLTLVMAILFAIAIAIVLMRRRKEELQRVAIEWTRVHEMLADRGVGPEEKKRFIAMVTRVRPKEPLTVATRRHQFDLCLDDEMDWLAERLSPEQLIVAGTELRDVRVALGLDYIPFGQRIESTRELHVGQELWLLDAAKPTAQWRRAEISVLDEARMVVTALPNPGEAPPAYPVGARLHCRIWRVDDARYQFDLVVQDAETKPVRWSFGHTRELQRIQDRAHFRVRVDHPVELDVLNAPRDDDYEGVVNAPAVTTIRGRITNLSAGGAAMITTQALPKQILLRFPLMLPEAGRLVLIAKPIAVTPQSAGRFLVRASFVAIDDESRDGIARYVLHRQQQLANPTPGEKVTLR